MYQVLLYYLQRQLNKKASKSTQAATNKVLTKAQKSVISKYINFLHNINICAESKIIGGIVHYVICLENYPLNHQ